MTAALTLDPAFDPWQRQPKETAKRYGQFCTYRDQGRTRTLRVVAEMLALNARYVRMVAADMRWTERVEAFDRHLDQLHQAAWLEERRKAARADAELLSEAVTKLAERVETLNPDELSISDFTRLLDAVMRHRRALFGDPEVTVALTGPGGDPLTVQVAEYVQMGAEQRRRAVEEMAASVLRRVRAVSDVDDDDE